MLNTHLTLFICMNANQSNATYCLVFYSLTRNSVDNMQSTHFQQHVDGRDSKDLFHF